MQQPVGKDVAALGIGAQLDLVDREEAHLQVGRHGLHGGYEITRGRRLDALLAGDQGGQGGALLQDDPVVDLARQQAQGEADEAAAVGQHPLDREMGLAGIGRPEHREDTRSFVRHQRHALTIGDVDVPWQAPSLRSGTDLQRFRLNGGVGLPTSGPTRGEPASSN
jgi:hypothetical protein